MSEPTVTFRSAPFTPVAALVVGVLLVATGPLVARAEDEPQITAGTKALPLSGESFELDGHQAFVIAPPKAPVDTPWVWYAPTLPGLPGDAEIWLFQRLLKAGVAIAGIDVGESYGSPRGREEYDSFYHYLVEKRHFNKKPVLLARSRGGLMLYSWAAEHPDSVSGIGGIYPVCNLDSYPGIERACGAFGLTAEQLRGELETHNPVDRLAGLARQKVPLFHLHGDSDEVVPLELNSGMVAQRYKKLGGEMTLQVIAGQGHNMWPGWFQSQQLADFLVAAATASHEKDTGQHGPALESKGSLKIFGKAGPGKGKHVVLIAAEQEYRSEQAMPMLARVLSQHHGFDCTVLFSVNDQGQVDPTLPAPFKDKAKRHHIPRLNTLDDADCLIWMSRFMQLPDDQMQYFHDYFDSGKPIIALRTANHGFWGGKKYVRDGKTVSLRELLGGAFMGHHGGWHRESTRGLLVPEQKSHPILTGVDDVWGTSDVYRCHNERFPFPDDCVALVLGQPLVTLQPDADPNPEKEPLPVAWTKVWTGNEGRSSKIFHFTMGSGEDFQNEGVRRLTVNAVYWGLGMERSIRPDASVEIVGDYQPLGPGFNYEKLGVHPRDVSHYE